MSDIHFDFAGLLVTLALFTGIITGLNYLFWRKKRAEGAKEPILVEYSRSFFPVIFVVLILRSFLVEPFRIPSGSMLPTLHIGDFILVNKFSYGVRTPVSHLKLLDLGEPERGDVVVFRYPKDASQDYIKRVIGLPGDTITYKNKRVFVNGSALPLVAKGDYPSEIPGLSKKQFEEQIGELTHSIALYPDQFSHSKTYKVPLGHYFVMGDNRDNSEDSRYWGAVPEENLVGKAFFIWMNWGEWNRIGTIIN